MLVKIKAGDTLFLDLSAVIGKADNPCNEELTDRYIEDLQMDFKDARILSVVKEGFKYYSADNVLLRTVPDEPVPEPAVEPLFRDMTESEGSYLYNVEKLGDDTYKLYLDTEDGATYEVSLKCSKVITEWENFQNKA